MKIKSNRNSVSIIGLGFVGLTLAAVMSEAGFRVHGVEKKKDIIEKLKKKISHFYEPNLNKILDKIIRKKTFSFSEKFINLNSKIYIITVGTPLNNKKQIITKYIKQTCQQISKRLNNDDIVILRSTVKVGTTRNIAYPILKKSKKKFHLAYCPERAVEGAALKELKKLPQVIGVLNKESEALIKNIFKKITKKIVVASSLETAEMIKLIDNSSRDVFFAYANEIARICDYLGLNANEIIGSGKLGYKRTDIARPGLVGGPCLHKDPYIFSESLKKFKIKPEITLTARKINERQPEEIIKFIYNKFYKNEIKNKKIKVGLLGIAFKGYPLTDDLRGSMAIKLINVLKKKFKNLRIFGFDPVVEKKKILNEKISSVKNLNEIFNKADIVIISNDNKYFSKLNLSKLSSKMNLNGLIYDVWNLYDKDKLRLNKNINYFSLGNQGLGK
tara:strand:- start:26420 stop:27754 length:1335 start_codon:yes stop_codon:yes gene_type:complete